MTKDEFMAIVINDLTASGSLPFKISKPELERIINIEKQWMYREYRDAVENEIYVLNQNYFRTPEFKETRSIVLPPCVIGIQKLWEITGGQRVLGINDPDLRFDRVMSADLYLTPFSTDQIMYRTLQWSFWDLTRSFVLNDIAHNFNINTKKLTILGRNPANSLFVVTLNQISEDKLYDDPIFQRWIIAKAKISLSKVLGLFDYNLVGNIKINYSTYRDEGKEEITELKELIRGNDTADWFLMFN